MSGVVDRWPVLRGAVLIDGHVRYDWRTRDGVPLLHGGDWYDDIDHAEKIDLFFGRRSVLVLASESAAESKRKAEEESERRRNRMPFVEQDP